MTTQHGDRTMTTKRTNTGTGSLARRMRRLIETTPRRELLAKIKMLKSDDTQQRFLAAIVRFDRRAAK